MKAFKFTRQAAKRMTCALLCVLTLTTVSCSQEEENAPEGAVKRVTATAAMPEDGLETRVVYPGGNDPQWERTDVFGVWKEGTQNISTFARTDSEGNLATALFGGDIACKEGDQLYAIYPKPSSVGGDNQSYMNLSSQSTGFGKNDTKQHYMYAHSTLKSDGTVDFEFKHAVAMMQITFTGEQPTEFKLTADGLYIAENLQMTPEGGNVTYQLPGEISVYGDFSSKKALIYLFPGSLTNVELTIDKKFIVPLGDKNVEAGKAYTINVPFYPI